MKLWLSLDSDVKVDDDKLREDFDYIDLFLATHIIHAYAKKKNMLAEMCEWINEKYLILFGEPFTEEKENDDRSGQ